MKSRFFTLLAMGVSALACAVALWVSSVPPTRAANLNTPGSACRSIDEDENFFINHVGIQNITNAPFTVTCHIVSGTPVPAFSLATFYIDGTNPPGMKTSCSVVSYSLGGFLLGSTSFANNTEARYDALLTLPASAVPYSAYVAAVCILPPGGMLRGISIIQ